MEGVLPSYPGKMFSKLLIIAKIYGRNKLMKYSEKIVIYLLTKIVGLLSLYYIKNDNKI